MSHISHVIVLCSFLTTFFPVFYFTACFHPPSNEGARKEGTVTDSLSSAVAEFDTFAEALKHEENCKITRPSVESTMLPVLSKNIGRSATQETENSTTQDTKMKTMWTCDFCDTARFNTFEEALKHEKKCKASKSTAAMNKVQPDSAKEKPKTSATEGAKLVTKWTCD
eukprot:15336259-Ditylum_brightwellii.AAC.1